MSRNIPIRAVLTRQEAGALLLILDDALRCLDGAPGTEAAEDAIEGVAAKLTAAIKDHDATEAFFDNMGRLAAREGHAPSHHPMQGDQP